MKLNIYDSVRRAYIHPSQVQDIDFDTFVLLCIESQQELAEKEDGQLFNLCSWTDNFENPNEERFNPKNSAYPRTELIRRCKANVEKIYCLLLDIDGTMTLAETVELWKDFEFLIYSTHSNSAEKEKFRLVVPLAQPLRREDFDARHQAMCETFNVDRASFTISQAFYFPSYSAGNRDSAFVYHNTSKQRYNALILPADDISYNVLTDVPVEGHRDPLANSIYRTLKTGKNMRYADALSVAVLCKSVGLGEAEYVDIVNSIAGVDSSLRTGLADPRHMFKQGYRVHMKRSNMAKIMKDLNCDMWRFIS